MVTVHRPNEISLFGTRYPMIGTVKSVRIPDFAEKQVTGDISKEDSVVDSTWVFVGNQTGGIGVLEMLEKKDTDRCFFSTCWIQTNGHLLLGALVTSTTNPTSDSEPEVTIEYVNAQYCAFGTALHQWSEGSESWGTSIGALVQVPTDVILHKNKIYFASGTDFNRYDGSTLTTGATLAGSAKAARFFVEWDDKLFRLANDGIFEWTHDEGATWYASATTDLPTASFTGLFVGENAAGDLIIYMNTQFGTFGLDFDGNKWLATQLTWPQHEFGGQGSTQFEDATYIPSGMKINKYRPGDRRVIDVGLDRDDGTPEAQRGNTIALVPGHRELYNLVDATSAATQNLFPGSQGFTSGDVQIYDNVGASLVARYRRVPPLNDPNRDGAWSVIYTADTAGLPAKCMAVSTSDGFYRLWFGIEETMKYISLQRDINNPLEIDGFLFDAARGGEHLTSRFDADKATTSKTARRVRGRVENCTTTEYVIIYYRINADTTWTKMTSDTYTDGQVDANGEFSMDFEDEAGAEFDSIQFKVELYSGSNTLSPDLRYARLEYLKQRDPVYGYRVRVDAQRNYRNSTGKSRRAALKTANLTKTLGQFAFMNAGESETFRVRVQEYEGVEIGGRYSQGVYDLLLLAP
jgi:hypothetical protein